MEAVLTLLRLRLCITIDSSASSLDQFTQLTLHRHGLVVRPPVCLMLGARLRCGSILPAALCSVWKEQHTVGTCTIRSALHSPALLALHSPALPCLPCTVLPCIVLSWFALPCLPCIVLPCFALPCLPCPVLSSFVWFCPTSPCTA